MNLNLETVKFFAWIFVFPCSLLSTLITDDLLPARHSADTETQMGCGHHFSLQL